MRELISSTQERSAQFQVLPDQGEVHIWRAWLDLPDHQSEKLHAYLSADERARARRFYFPKHQRRFATAHGVLRAILARYSQAYVCPDPSQLVFQYGSHGKPTLSRTCGGETIRFSLSHSQDFLLLGVGQRHELGVDVERIHSDLAWEEIADACFSSQEIDALRAMPVTQRTEAFFRFWTSKESYVKARGEGLFFPLKQFTVALVEGRCQRLLLNSNHDEEKEVMWSIHSLDVSAEYAAALTVEGNLERIRYQDWPPGGPSDVART